MTHPNTTLNLTQILSAALTPKQTFLGLTPILSAARTLRTLSASHPSHRLSLSRSLSGFRSSPSMSPALHPRLIRRFQFSDHDVSSSPPSAYSAL
nr:hypothetical protein Iba_chr12dCG18320 [Ipomoea batatas]